MASFAAEGAAAGAPRSSEAETAGPGGFVAGCRTTAALVGNATDPGAPGAGGPQRPPVYLDNAATTRLSDEAFAAMEPWLRGAWGNASAAYGLGRAARAAVEDARERIAATIGAQPDEVYFTSCGTESDAWALSGVMHADARERGRARRVVTSAVEHPAVLEGVAQLRRRGFQASVVDVDGDALVDEAAFRDAVASDAALASVMLANNETGAIEPVARLAEAAHERGALFHTDAVQAFGHIPVNVDALGVDLLSASAHKFHGPKGMGFLYVRRGTPIEPLLCGGHQERGMRAGTENVAGIAGMAAAAEAAVRGLSRDMPRIAALRDSLFGLIRDQVPDALENGAGAPRVPGTLNVAVAGADAVALVELLDAAGVCASGGSACSTGTGKPSHVLSAMGLSLPRIQGSVRFSLSDQTTRADVEAAADAFARAVAHLRAFSDFIELP